jgi:multidrug efflux pump subunit AcrB
MNLKTFIARPVLSAVISIVIVVMGVISLFNLPVERFPDIAPPTVYVSTGYCFLQFATKVWS